MTSNLDPMTDKTIRWGILAAGSIAGSFAKAVNATEGNVLHGIASREIEKARAFAEKYAVNRTYGSYGDLLEDSEVDAVYIATLHPFHLEWIAHAVRAGKHVLCEKPLTMNHREAKVAQKLATDNKCLLREAFMYRHHPQTQKLADLVADGAIGKLRMIESNFCFNSGIHPESRLQAKELGGGGILDVGCYTMSFARLIAGRAQGRLFAEPLELKAVGHIDPQTKTDMWTTASLRFEGDILAKLTCAVRMDGGIQSKIYGETGRIEVDSPWFGRGDIRIIRKDQPDEVIKPLSDRDLYSFEIEAFANELNGRPIGANAVGMRFDDTLGNMKALDRWRAEIGLGYEADRVG